MAGALQAQPYQVTRPSDPLGTGFATVHVAASIDGIFEVTSNAVFQTFVIAFGSFDIDAAPLLNSGADCQLTPTSSGCTGLTSGISFTPDSMNPLKVYVSGTVEDDFLVPVNQLSYLGASLTPYAGLDAAAITWTGDAKFDNTLGLSVTSADPDIQLTLVPEPSTALLLGFAIVALTGPRGRRRTR